LKRYTLPELEHRQIVDKICKLFENINQTLEPIKVKDEVCNRKLKI